MSTNSAITAKSFMLRVTTVAPKSLAEAAIKMSWKKER